MKKSDGKNEQEHSLSIGQVAARSGVSVPTLHFYETKDLIDSWRNTGNQRRYNKSVLRKIAVIKTAQRLGLTLDSIAATLSKLPVGRSPTRDDWKNLSQQWRAELDEKIRQLTLLRDDLDGCIGCGCLSLEQCPLRNPNDICATKGSGPVVWE